jgi:prepilin-type processing-associated H-X9-DG protein/prepilin-type N-terminal cleavage/methylation domain-containing protein
MSPIQYQKRTAPSGFTLVEVLVTITIIMALATIGTIVSKRIRQTSNMVVCMSNMRQIGVAMQIYADDHQGSYPDTSHTASAETAWIYQLEEYFGKFDEVRICPADPNAALRLKNKSSSYILNSLVFVPPMDAFGEPDGTARNKPALLPDPSATILVFIASDTAGIYPGDDHTHSDRWTSWAAVIQDISPNRHNRGGYSDSANGGSNPLDTDVSKHGPSSTGGSSNYLYADGHVESITANEIKSKIEAGRNIAEIPGIER